MVESDGVIKSQMADGRYSQRHATRSEAERRVRREEAQHAAWLKGYHAAQARKRAEQAERMGVDDPGLSDDEFLADSGTLQTADQGHRIRPKRGTEWPSGTLQWPRSTTS